MNYSIDILRVSAEAVVVEAITYHEIVGNLLAAVTHVELDLQFAGFEQECADVDAGGIVPLERLEHVGHSETGVDDVFHDDDRPTCNVDIEADYFADGARGVCPLIGSELDKRDLAGQVHLAQKVCGEDKGTIEYSEENRLASSVVAADFFGHAFYFFLYFCFGDGDGERLVEHLDCFGLLHEFI